MLNVMFILGWEGCRPLLKVLMSPKVLRPPNTTPRYRVRAAGPFWGRRLNLWGSL